MEYEIDDSIPSNLPMLRHRRYTNTKNVRVKKFQNPRVCEAVHSHYCFKTPTVKLSYSLARVHHYRNQCQSHHDPKRWSEENCEILRQKSVIDNETIRFKEEMLQRVGKIWDMLN